MILLIIRILAIIISLTVITKTYYDFKKHNESVTMLVFWAITWGLVVVAAMFPSIVIGVTNIIGQKGIGTGTLFGLVILFILFISYRIYVKANRIEKQFSKIITEIALIKNQTKD